MQPDPTDTVLLTIIGIGIGIIIGIDIIFGINIGINIGIIIGIIIDHRIKYYYHPPHLFDHIYQSVSLLRHTGSFALSLFTCLLFPPPSTVSIYQPLYLILP